MAKSARKKVETSKIHPNPMVFEDWSPSHFDPLKPGTLLGPMGMCVDSKDRLFVADCASDRVQIFSREGHSEPRFHSLACHSCR